MVKNHNIHGACGGLNLMGNVKISLRRGDVTAGMIMGQNNICCIKVKRSLDDFPGKDSRLVNGACLLSLVADQNILGI